MGSSKANDMKIFKQEALPTCALDTTYDRVGSVSPLKYRPQIDLEGLPDPKDKDQGQDRG